MQEGVVLSEEERGTRLRQQLLSSRDVAMVTFYCYGEIHLCCYQDVYTALAAIRYSGQELKSGPLGRK